MAWSKLQLAAVHIAKNALHWQDPQYRLILRNVAGIYPLHGKVSGTNPSASDAGFVRFMAYAERAGYIDPKNGQFYWTQELAKQCARMHWKIRDIMQRAVEAGLVTPRPGITWEGVLAGFIENHTVNREAGRTRNLDELDGLDSFNILEGLKAWVFREAKARGRDFNFSTSTSFVEGAL